MKINYVLIDFENVVPGNLAGLEAEHFRVLVFMGANQTRISSEIAIAMQNLGDRGSYVKCAGNGKNALDFHIAWHLGKLAVEEPAAYFHIISKDTGFDPLLAHLKERKIQAKRWAAVSEIPALQPVQLMPLQEKADLVIAHLRKASKPRTLKTLTSSVHAILGKQLTDHQVEAVISRLQSEGFVTLKEGNKVEYSLPATAA